MLRPPRHLIALVLDCVPSLCVPRLVPLPCFASPRHLVARAVPWRLASPPRLIDTTSGAIRMALRWLSALLACLSARHLIRAVRHRMATWFCACLIKLPPACSPPRGHYLCRLLPARSSRPTGSHRPSPRPPTRRAGRAACFSCGAVHVRTMRYNPHSRYSSRRRSSSCLLAPSPLTAVAEALLLIGSAINPSIRFVPVAPLNRHVERGERRGGLLSCLMWMSGLPIPSIVLDKGTAAISFCILSLLIVWIACPPSCDCRAIVRRAMRVVMGSGLSLVRLFPLLFRIPCGFVSFAPIAPPRRPVPSHPCPSNPVLFVPSP